MPTALGALPSTQPIPNGRVQVKVAAITGSEAWMDASNNGQKLFDGGSGAMEVAYTPIYPCYWVVRSNLITRGIAGGWQRWHYDIKLSQPDRVGFQVTRVATQNHESVGWCAFAGAAIFRLAAGVAYTCALHAGYSSGGTQAWYCSNEYSRLIGRVVSEGVD
jgi:hypothetical protein